jgi:hypothetical protein
MTAYLAVNDSQIGELRPLAYSLPQMQMQMQMQMQ